MDVLKIIYEALDEVNLDLEDNEKIQKSEVSLIFSAGSSLDSLGEETGDFLSIADERAMSMESSPFKSVKTLKKYIESILNEH
jgi:hypothetical protein